MSGDLPYDVIEIVKFQTTSRKMKISKVIDANRTVYEKTQY